MFKCKYILHRNGTPVIFSEVFKHSDVARSLFGSTDNIVGAGFCYIQDDKYHCYGESVSLNVKSGEEKDAKILNRLVW